MMTWDSVSLIEFEEYLASYIPKSALHYWYRRVKYMCETYQTV